VLVDNGAYLARKHTDLDHSHQCVLSQVFILDMGLYLISDNDIFLIHKKGKIDEILVKVNAFFVLDDLS